MARVMHELGFEEPSTENLQVKSDGVELDISLRHDLNRTRAIAECKAYSTNIPVGLVTAFYGRLAAERLDDERLEGYFFALPRLTSDATQFASKTAARDSGFHFFTADSIWKLLAKRGLIRPVLGEAISDPALVVHPSGIYTAAIELDASSRTASRVRVRSGSGAAVPAAVVTLLESSDYAQDLEVAAGDTAEPAQPHVGSTPLLVEVNGSESDFEYQLPASPRFFVGRRDPLSILEDTIQSGSGPFVLNAQSGWGKSSLALKTAATIDGVAIVLDTRTANSPAYVPAALRHAAAKAQRDGVCRLPEGATWATTEGALTSIESADWVANKRLLIVFDQFENVFTDQTITTEFRNVALWTAEQSEHITIGFAWKTDYVDWIETHPFRLRDQIRSASTVVNLQPFGSAEVETILRRLEQAVGLKLSRELRQRLREYSQGLPWLLKKLSGHLIREFSLGKSQEQLIGEALNVQDLFDSDLAGLSPQEREALNFVARFAPVQASEVTERFQAALVQSLLNQRLIVQVGEKLDTYWDIFRDYLNTGRVPIEDSYILRLTPNSVARLVSELLAQGGSASTAAIADAWDTSENVVWNSLRELRQLGLAASATGQAKLIPEIQEAVDSEAEIRIRVARALRRHRAWSEFSDLAERGQGIVTPPLLARRLQEAFPAVTGTQHTWITYARTFHAWFAYAGLAVGSVGELSIAPEGSAGVGSLTSKAPAVLRKGVFPTAAPGPAIEILRNLAFDPSYTVPPEKKKYLAQLLALGAVVPSPDGPGVVPVPGLLSNGDVVQSVLRGLLRATAGGETAMQALAADSGISAVDMGAIFERAYAVTWTESTKDLVGRSFFGWARAAGLSTKRSSRRRTRKVSAEEGKAG